MKCLEDHNKYIATGMYQNNPLKFDGITLEYTRYL